MALQPCQVWFQSLNRANASFDPAKKATRAVNPPKFQSLNRGVQVIYLSKQGIPPILDRAGLPEKQEQVTSQLKSQPLLIKNRASKLLLKRIFE
jgi:hypothetical protein